MDAAYKAGIAKIDDMIKKHEMTIDEAEKTPHGYSWSSVVKEDGSEGYRASLYGSDSVPNDKAPETPEQPGTPEQPVETDIEAGLPKNAKWTRTQLQKWGFGIGKITGDYKVDGDLGAFDTEDELDKAFKKGKEALNRAHHDGAISEEVYNNAPKTMLNEVDPGPAGYKGNLYDANQLGNDGNPMPDLDDEE